MWTESPWCGGQSGADRPSLRVLCWPLGTCFHLFFHYSLNYGGVCLASDAQFSDFLGSMGPAQFVGRQTLATTPMGECPKTFSKGGGPTGRPAPPSSSPLPWLHLLSTQLRAWSTPARPSAEPGHVVWELVLVLFWAGSRRRGLNPKQRGISESLIEL